MTDILSILDKKARAISESIHVFRKFYLFYKWNAHRIGLLFDWYGEGFYLQLNHAQLHPFRQNKCSKWIIVQKSNLCSPILLSIECSSILISSYMLMKILNVSNKKFPNWLKQTYTSVLNFFQQLLLIKMTPSL